MAWKHPDFLWGLAALCGLAGLYLALLRQRAARGVVFYPFSHLLGAGTHAGRIRRHLAAALFLLALAATVIGAAGPVVPWPVPTGSPVVLIIDISRSMEETDIAPSRIEATKVASVDFLAGLPRASKVALVSFGNYATLLVPLTSDRGLLREGVRNLTTQLRTQLGTGLVEGVRAVAGEGDANVPSDRPKAIAILMSDGRASDGVPPLEAAEEARRRGVRVYTVGVGTTTDPTRLRSGYWGVLDEPTLRAIADTTGGEYFHAAEAGRLRTIYRELARTVGWERRPQEATAVAGGIAMLLLIAALLLQSRISPLH